MRGPLARPRHRCVRRLSTPEVTRIFQNRFKWIGAPPGTSPFVERLSWRGDRRFDQSSADFGPVFTSLANRVWNGCSLPEMLLGRLPGNQPPCRIRRSPWFYLDNRNVHAARPPTHRGSPFSNTTTTSRSGFVAPPIVLEYSAAAVGLQGASMELRGEPTGRKVTSGSTSRAEELVDGDDVTDGRRVPSRRHGRGGGDASSKGCKKRRHPTVELPATVLYNGRQLEGSSPKGLPVRKNL